ncbi:2-phospho-L-lactate guanylyltransferase [Nocardiopsis sp. HNM0947]|uniref:Phosphoenolpyruvate guanylyltransferase n=1 Tax=Nocardiopsis coralli TaxID=2772213 RepID=A0ABR9P8G6_9ACTN|nr:2-phospho-L-lactate guanylyltransferase [Nocardiopsis coralli]MBE3000109.1 2-phospho-L-lactate guanylyltransferase [Nocardiopsis coralli]
MTGPAERGEQTRGERWSLIVPVKHLGRAKSRLARAAGPHRADLALAIACDTVAAALECPAVDRVLAVTDDPRAGTALEALGALVVPGEPGTGLNPALEHGEAAARDLGPVRGLCALSADLPALRPAELALVLGAAGRHRRAFLADAPGIGTTLLAATGGARLRPAFEGASRARHARSGAHELVVAGAASVRRDVDTPQDLRAAAELGLGPRTARWLDRAGGAGGDAALTYGPGHSSARVPSWGDPGGNSPSPSSGEATSCPR